MNPLSRFQFVRASEKGPEDMPTEGKSLREVLDFNAKGKYDVEAKVTDFQVEVYEVTYLLK